MDFTLKGGIKFYNPRGPYFAVMKIFCPRARPQAEISLRNPRAVKFYPSLERKIHDARVLVVCNVIIA